MRLCATSTKWVLAFVFAPFVLLLYGLRHLGGKYEDCCYMDDAMCATDVAYRFVSTLEDGVLAGVTAFTSVAWLFILAACIAHL